MPFEIPATTVNHGLEVGDMIIDSRINFLYQQIENQNVFLGFLIYLILMVMVILGPIELPELNLLQ